MANRYWVGGAGNWSDTAHWSATSGGASGASVPGSADTATFNASSGAGIATVDSNVTIQRLTMSGFTGTLAYGTNTISLNSTGTVFQGDTTYSVTGTPVINVTSTGSTLISVAPTTTTFANSVSFNFTGGTYLLSFNAGSVKNVDFTGYSGLVGNGLNSSIIYGNLTLSSGMSLSSGGSLTLSQPSGTKLITTNSKIFNCPVSFVGPGTQQLVDNFTVSSTEAAVLTSGTLNLNNNSLTCGGFFSSNSNTRSIAFGTGSIICGGTGTAWNTATVTGFTITGTPVVNITSAGSTAITVAPGALSEANSVSFNFTAGTYALTFLSAASYAAKNVDFTGFAGTWAATSTGVIYGNLTISTGMALTASASAMTFGATSGTKTITSNTKTIDFPVTFNGVGGTFRLIDAMTLGATRTTTLTSGTLDLDGKTLTTGLFSATGSTARTIAFGAGNIICNAAGGTLWTTATVTNLTITGTPVVNISNSGAVATSVLPGQLSQTSSISFNFTTGTYALTFLDSANFSAKNVDFTGFAGTWGTTSTGIIYGNLTLSTGMTLTASGSTMSFSATSGTQIVTSNAKTMDFPITINGVGGTVRLADALTVGATATLTFTNGTLDLNGKTLTTGLFSGTGSAARTLAFGAGNIICNAAGGTLWTTATVTNLTVTGTPVVNISNSGAVATSVLPGALSEANSISFNFTTGTYSLTFLGTVSYAAKNVDFTGFAGTWAARTVASTIYGNLTLSSAAGFSLAASSGILTFGATSGTQVITSNAKTIDEPLTVNGVGGTVRLADALLMGTTRTLTHTNGTLDLNGKTLTVGTAYTTATGTKNLTFNGGTLVCPTAAATAFNNAVPTGFTTTAGTGTGKISTTGATAKSFVGGGSIYNCTLSNDGAGAVNISGANTFTTIANGVQPTAFIFPSSTTTTVTNWNVSGTAGNLVTITSSAAGTAATLSKASGTVSSNYLSLKDSAATGGATWYAGANSTNVSGNSGWIFTAPPVVTAGGNFFFMF
jgi:hypothetical protein